MEIAEVIRQRKSIHAFKPDPVPVELLKKIIGLALRAPSWANTQPWQFAIVAGEFLKKIQKAFVERGEQEPSPEIDRPYKFPEPYLSRIQALAPEGRTPTKEELHFIRIQNYKNYGATTIIYLLIDRNFFYQEKGINVWSLYDCGSVVQNIMLLATSYGLGTIAQAHSVLYPDVIRKVIDIDENKIIALGIAIGYPDWDYPGNKKSTVREPLDNMAKWYGF